MIGIIAPIIIGFVAAAAAWIIFVPLSTPRLKWSRKIADNDSLFPRRYQVKLLNQRPWSARDVTVTCLLVAPGLSRERVVVNLPLREDRIPMIGGWALRRRRIRKFGWLGASHRILSLQVDEIGEADLHRLNQNAQAWLQSRDRDSLDNLLSSESELALIATARDSLFFGRMGVYTQIYRHGTVVTGSFQRGRSLNVVQGRGHGEPQVKGFGSTGSRISIDDEFLVDVGLGGLPSVLRPQMKKYLYEKLELSVGQDLADQMTDSQMDEFERYYEAKDDAGAFAWLERNFPDYRSVVHRKLEELRVTVRASASDILRAEGIEHLQSVTRGALSNQPVVAPEQPS